ncbi:hypothetical protein M7I_2573 [Glarea lozoyensis 74030]|uniref:Uncharacterized protein n=1 Tax=Glarea lozoyensis (strain ATCC 74030 / MF5533) TaxID=1104152 RepID=H0EJ49_GLAL7|nr:hypothetical protein M7I_2573 [Glarea lozoyensis 74030]
MNAHCLRGASLLSMPLEVGTMAVQTSIKTAAGTAYAAIAVTEKLQKVTTNKKVKAVMSSVTKMAESRAAKTSLAVMEKGAAMAAEAAGDTTAMVLGESVIVVGGVEISLQNGPGKLYPIHLTARTQTPYILQPEEYPDPQFAMTLSDVSNFAPNIIGSYFGWARFSPPKKSEESVDSTWQSIILHALPPTSAQLQRATISSANKLFFSLQLLSEIDTSIPPLSSVEIELMGYLRAPPPVSYGAAPIPIPGAIPELNYVDFDDRAMAMMVLDEMAWSPEAAAALRRGEKLQGFAKFVGGVSDVKGVALGQLGKLSTDVSKLWKSDLRCI